MVVSVCFSTITMGAVIDSNMYLFVVLEAIFVDPGNKDSVCSVVHSNSSVATSDRVLSNQVIELGAMLKLTFGILKPPRLLSLGAGAGTGAGASPPPGFGRGNKHAPVSRVGFEY